MTMPTDTTTLLSIKAGDILVSKKGHQWRVHEVRKPHRKIYDKEQHDFIQYFRLERTVICNSEWTASELSAQGLKKIE